MLSKFNKFLTGSSLKNKISKLSQSPGVYVFCGENKEILYVGKATNLRSRVQSYFRGGESKRLIGIFIDQVADIKVQETDSVLEALILESNLIKKYQPKYNAMGKDDKSFCYFVITKETFPRVVIVRATDLGINSKSEIRNPKQIQKSPPKADLPRAEKFKNIKVNNIFGPYVSKKQMEVALKIMRKIFPFHGSAQKMEKGCLDFQIGLCPGPYAGAIVKEDYRKNIRGIKMILEGKKKNLVKKLEKEMKELAKKHEYEKAGEMRNKIFALKHIRDVAIIADNLQPTTYNIQPLRIEAYDISNISRDHAVGSMVVFENGEPDKSQYRKFRIKTVAGIDDVGAMREVLLRRFNNDWPQPDLILLDGGVGHLNMGAEVLKKLELNIPIAAAAKGKNRKNLELRILNLELESGIKNIVDNKNLLKKIMDEAHRFAVAYHRKLRKKHLIP